MRGIDNHASVVFDHAIGRAQIGKPQIVPPVPSRRNVRANISSRSALRRRPRHQRAVAVLRGAAVEVARQHFKPGSAPALPRGPSYRRIRLRWLPPVLQSGTGHRRQGLFGGAGARAHQLSTFEQDGEFIAAAHQPQFHAAWPAPFRSSRARSLKAHSPRSVASVADPHRNQAARTFVSPVPAWKMRVPPS